MQTNTNNVNALKLNKKLYGLRHEQCKTIKKCQQIKRWM
jgi:hypothetical protein